MANHRYNNIQMLKDNLNHIQDIRESQNWYELSTMDDMEIENFLRKNYPNESRTDMGWFEKLIIN